MLNRSYLALAAVSISCFLPPAVYAGAGGTPVTPGAGRSTDYCCVALETVTVRLGSGGTLTFMNGTGCKALPEDPGARNTCGSDTGEAGPGTVVKCRGELFNPSAGTVQRCLTP